MRRRAVRVVVPILLLLFVVYALFGGGAGTQRLIDAEGHRIFVADGDTLRIGGETVRLAGIDAVERLQFCTDATGKSWSCGQTALRMLEHIVARGGLRCTTLDHDRYGRAIAHCAATGEADIGAAMVAAGWAVSDRGGRYGAQDQDARDAKRGIWAGAFERPDLWRARNRIAPKQTG